MKSSFLQGFLHCVSKEHLGVRTALLPDSGKSSLCPQEAATLGLLFRPSKVCIWDPQLRVDEKVFGGWSLVSWLQRMEIPEEVSLGDGTLGTKMVRTQEKEKIIQEVWSIQLSGDTSS